MKRIFIILMMVASPSWADDYQAGYSHGYDNGATITDNSQFNAGAAAADIDRAIDDSELEHKNQESTVESNYNPHPDTMLRTYR